MASFALTYSKRMRYEYQSTLRWVDSGSPVSWHGRVKVHFTTVHFGLLEPAGSLTDPAIIEKYLRMLKTGRAISPPVGMLTNHGSYYLHDGNHRYRALEQYLGTFPYADLVQLAIVEAKPGYCFRERNFGEYRTYRLEPVTYHLHDEPGMLRRGALVAAV